MKYSIFYYEKQNEGIIVAQNGIYDLVQFDADPLDNILEDMTWIISDYFPNYLYNTRDYVYGLGVGGHLVVHGPGPEGRQVSNDELRAQINRLRIRTENAIPANWNNDFEESIYKELHSVVLSQFNEIKQTTNKIYKNKCSLGELVCDDNNEYIYIDIFKDKIAIRVFLKAFSSQIAHNSSDSKQLSRFVTQGGKAVIGFGILQEEYGLSCSDPIFNLENRIHSITRHTFTSHDEDFDGDYESAAVISLCEISYSFIHSVYQLIKGLSEDIDKSTKFETDLDDDTDWDNLDLSDFSLEDEEPYAFPIDSQLDYAEYFDEWLFSFNNLD